METITRQVRDIDAADRNALEHVIGRKLQENQQVIFQVVSLGTSSPAADRGTASSGRLPEWCGVFNGLTDEEVEAVDGVIRERADLSRPTD